MDKEVNAVLADVFSPDVKHVTTSVEVAIKVLKYVKKHLKNERLKFKYNNGVVRISEIRTKRS